MFLSVFRQLLLIAYVTSPIPENATDTSIKEGKRQKHVGSLSEDNQTLNEEEKPNTQRVACQPIG